MTQSRDCCGAKQALTKFDGISGYCRVILPISPVVQADPRRVALRCWVNSTQLADVGPELLHGTGTKRVAGGNHDAEIVG